MIAGKLAVLLVIVAAALCVAAILARRILRESAGRSRLERAARTHGVELPGAAAAPWAHGLAHGDPRAAHAAQCCASCANAQRCDEILAAGNLQALRAICRNTAYLEQLKREAHRIY